MEHDYLIQQEAKTHMRTAEEEGRRGRLARSARAPRHWGGWMVLAAALSRAASATERAAEAIRSWVLQPAGAEGAAPGSGVTREANP
jgi:hypothetical protein